MVRGTEDSFSSWTIQLKTDKVILEMNYVSILELTVLFFIGFSWKNYLMHAAKDELFLDVKFRDILLLV